MIYRQRNNKKGRGIKIILSIFVFFIILRLFNITIFTHIFDNPINYILESNTIILSPLKNTFVYFKEKKDLQKKVEELQTENTDLKLDNLLNRNITEEFEYFKNQFGTISPQNNIYKVILRPPFTPFDSIRISGDLESKQVGDFVFYKNILIGKIVEKDNRYASVELFSSPEKTVPVILKGSQFEARGLGGGRYIFEASKEFEVVEGEPVVYPEKTILILGVVEFIESNEEDLFKKIYFNLPVTLDTISYVTVGI